MAPTVSAAGLIEPRHRGTRAYPGPHGHRTLLELAPIPQICVPGVSSRYRWRLSLAHVS